MSKTSIFEYYPSQLQKRVEELGLKPFVAKQVLEWVYKKSACEFSEMRNISKAGRQLLEEHFFINPLSLVEALDSKEKALKLISSCQDSMSVESVVLKEKTYNGFCISSQIGCPVDCKFCVTGAKGFKRQMSVSEIVGQVHLSETLGYPISHIVFMGMGEPMLNFDHVMKAIEILTHPDCFGISKRKITLSTAGYLPGIKRLIKEERFLNLAFSVGHTDSKVRRTFMPIEHRYAFSDVVAALKEYLGMHNRKLTLEYTLLKGLNDDEEAINGLAKLARILNAKVNLINLNPHPLIPYKPISNTQLKSFKTHLLNKGIRTTIRFRKGQDVAAACGQLGDSIK